MKPLTTARVMAWMVHRARAGTPPTNVAEAATHLNMEREAREYFLRRGLDAALNDSLHHVRSAQRIHQHEAVLMDRLTGEPRLARLTLIGADGITYLTGLTATPIDWLASATRDEEQASGLRTKAIAKREIAQQLQKAGVSCAAEMPGGASVFDELVQRAWGRDDSGENLAAA